MVGGGAAIMNDNLEPECFIDATCDDCLDDENQNDIFVSAIKKGINDSIGSELDTVRDYILDYPKIPLPDFTGIFNGKNLVPIYVIGAIMLMIAFSPIMKTNSNQADPSQNITTPYAPSITDTSYYSAGYRSNRIVTAINATYSPINTNYGSNLNSSLRTNTPETAFTNASLHNSIPIGQQMMPSRNPMASLNFQE